MEKEIINFEKIALPIKLHHTNMVQGNTYRGMHSHVAVEIVKVKSGELSCKVNHEVIYLRSGEVIFINSNVGHRLYPNNAEISYLQIDIGFFLENNNEKPLSELYKFISHIEDKPYLIFHDNKEIQEILNKIDTKYDDNQFSSSWYIKAYIYELIAFMYSQSFITKPIISKKQIEKIEPIVGYINSNFRNPITLDQICDELNYSKYALCHCFKSATGSTIFEYINFLRVHFAIEKLKEKGDSILNISVDSGFSSPTYFNRVFKNMIGCSPSVYRKFFTKTLGYL